MRLSFLVLAFLSLHSPVLSQVAEPARPRGLTKTVLCDTTGFKGVGTFEILRISELGRTSWLRLYLKAHEGSEATFRVERATKGPSTTGDTFTHKVESPKMIVTGTNPAPPRGVPALSVVDYYTGNGDIVVKLFDMKPGNTVSWRIELLE